MYLFDSHYGQSTLTDEETGIRISWQNGDFNNTQKPEVDPSTLAMIVPEGEDPAVFVAERLRKMGDHIAQNYPELI